MPNGATAEKKMWNKKFYPYVDLVLMLINSDRWKMVESHRAPSMKPDAFDIGNRIAVGVLDHFNPVLFFSLSRVYLGEIASATRLYDFGVSVIAWKIVEQHWIGVFCVKNAVKTSQDKNT